MISLLHQKIVNWGLILSLAVTPLYGAINEPTGYYETVDAAHCEPNCKDHSCCLMRSNRNFCLGAAVLVSAAVGALIAAGASRKQRGCLGPCGEKGPIGPQGKPVFEVDGTLTFQANFEIPTAGLTNPQAFFFVTSPDGTITRSESFAVVNGQVFTPHSITVPAIHGDYSMGLELAIDPLIVPVNTTAGTSFTIEPSNNSARDSKTLTRPASFHFPASSTPQAGQASVDYAYYPQKL